MRYRCKNCGYIYSYSLDSLESCQMCNGPKKDILAWDIDDGFLKQEKDKKRVWVSDFNPSIARINELCIDCGLCQTTCTQMTNISYDKQVEDNPVCINCGQCVLKCPTKALVPKYDYQSVLNYLNDTDYLVTISIAPAVRVAIGDLFGYEKGTFLEGKLVAALRKLGFDRVFDLTFGADVTVMEEATEFVDRLKNGKHLPQFTSCCPAWVKYAEMFHDDLLYNLSTTKSPISIQGALINSYYAEYNDLDVNKIINVMVAPCVAKKFEIKRFELPGMNYVITTEELIMMLKECQIDFTLLNDSEFDSMLGKGSSSGLIFGSSGGVLEAALRTSYYLLTNRKAPKDFYKLEAVRGMNEIKEATVDMDGTIIKVAAVYGMKALEEILKHKDDYAFIEVMNCPGGCVGGGGQPLLPAAQIKDYTEARSKSLYDVDAEANMKDSYENDEVIELYDTYLGRPLSKMAERLLHTNYHSRRYKVKHLD